MFPGVIAGQYLLDECQIDLRTLAVQASVSFVVAEINGINVVNKLLLLKNRAPLSFSSLSLDVGAEIKGQEEFVLEEKNQNIIPIKPFDSSFAWITHQDNESVLEDAKPFSVIGSGLAGLEVVLALRKRWPKRKLLLKVHPNGKTRKFKNLLKEKKIDLVLKPTPIVGPALLCTGSQVPRWLGKSGLNVDSSGRVLTSTKFQTFDYPFIFAAGDCGVIKECSRPSSGVWAVRAAEPLAKNIERFSQGRPLLIWRPQRIALQLVGGPFDASKALALGFWANLFLGPNQLLWIWKKFIDRKFMNMFAEVLNMKNTLKEQDGCRGCAAKIPAKPLKAALVKTDLIKKDEASKDAALIGVFFQGGKLLQSVDGFPALLSDPWLNARLTTLHACSDIWASGASVLSVQPVITLPKASPDLQEELLAQILEGIKSALAPQDAQIIGGHTMESRSGIPELTTLGIEIVLSVNGLVPKDFKIWNKSGIQVGDDLLLSREIGSGVLFAAAMYGEVHPNDLDFAIDKLSMSQHSLVESLLHMQKKSGVNDLVHACTDVTGFGLIGHLGEMLQATNSNRVENGLSPIKITLEAEKIPVLPGALDLIGKGYVSTLAPANHSFWSLLEDTSESPACLDLSLGGILPGSDAHMKIMEIIVDPQTCGPLLIACSSDSSELLMNNGLWSRIGSVGLI